MRYNVARMMFLSYGLVDVIGTILLLLPISSTESTNFMQAWFTATSALSVTGLTVVNTSTHWSFFGHLVILILMQIGGLGLMVLATVLMSLLGFRIHLGQRVLLVQDRNYFSISGVLKLVKNAIAITLIIEIMGACLIFLCLPESRSNGVFEGAFFALFHSISAFNGAGFDLTGQSLELYTSRIGFNLVIMALITLGSLGYVVLQELVAWPQDKKLSLHSRLVLIVTGSIIIVGGLFYWCTEYARTLSLFNPLEQCVVSLFQAVTRTAGFSTIPVLSWNEPFMLLMVMMMFIGASPGSVGGGLKTTTFGIVILKIASILRGQERVVVFEREIAAGTVTKAFVITVIMLGIVTISTLILMLTEGLPFLAVLFEVTSAISSVGLSSGVTSQLSLFGQILIGLLMFVGRIGVLSLILSLMGSKSKALQYMKEDVLIG